MYKNQFYLSPPIKEGAEIQQYPEQVFCHPERRDLQYWEGHHWASTRTRCPALSQLRGPAGSPERREPGPLGSPISPQASWLQAGHSKWEKQNYGLSWLGFAKQREVDEGSEVRLTWVQTLKFLHLPCGHVTSPFSHRMAVRTKGVRAGRVSSTAQGT